MKINILAFGIAKDIIGNAQLEFDLDEGLNIDDLRAQLLSEYEDFHKLKSLALAVNSEYAAAGQVLKENDEVAIIPPVSGG